jgi:hypothetical protein
MLLALWTVALLVPVPKESAKLVLGSDDEVFLFGKMVHVCVYAFLTVLGGSMTLSRPQRWAILGLLSFHGFATEFFQQFVHRGASWRDVGLDHVGITMGFLIGWRWWRDLFPQKVQS